MKDQGDNCYILSNDEGYVEEWTKNETIEDVNISPYAIYPHLIFTMLNQTHYQWCGPMLLIAEYFTKFSQTRVRLNPLELRETMENNKDEGSMPQIVLAPTAPTDYYRHVLEKDLGEVAVLSSYFFYFQSDGILAKTRKGNHHLLKQFECFEREVYYGIIVSIIVISFVTSLYKKSLKTFFTTFWSYLSVILSDYLPIEMKTLFDRVFGGLWLIICTILLAAFSGQTRVLMIKPIPIYCIDSWEDLHQWTDLSIQIFENSDLNNYIENFGSEQIAQDLKARIVSNITEDVLSENMISNKSLDYDGVREGRVAIVFNYDYLQKLKYNLMSKDFEEDIDFHISDENSQPSFTVINKFLLDDSLAHLWNFVIGIIRESGIYDHLYKVGLNPKRVGPDYNETSKITLFQKYKYVKLLSNQMRGLFLLYLIVNTISLIILISEFTSLFPRLFN